MPIRELVELVCALHDAGKLQTAWQQEAQKWQLHCDSAAGIASNPNEALAHTTYDPERDKGSAPRFPPHSSCGAFAAVDYFGKHFSSEAAVLCTAIARHHGAHTSRLDKYELRPDAVSVLEECLPPNAPRPLSVVPRASGLDTKRFSYDCLLHFFRKTSTRGRCT
jgi:CRISPR/Cas system-associated endonuclease Cas3-HD